MELLFWSVDLLIWFLYVARRMVQHLHMMQQNSYRTERFLRWLKPRKKTYLLKRDLVFAIFCLICSCITIITLSDTIVIAAIIFWPLVFMHLTWERPKEKKPLAFTARAKRLYGASLLLYLLLLIVVVVLSVYGQHWALSFLGLGSFLSPYMMVAAAALMKPVENHINQGYLNDAKRIIQEMPQLITIGITGSYGKTSSKFILGRVLSESKHTLVTPDSYNTPMGITITIRNSLKPIHQVFVAEMGARQVGDIQELCDLVQPKIGILTAIGPQHLETFGTIDMVAKTKFELIDSLPQDGLAVLNLDDEQIRKRLPDVKVKAITYGLEQNQEADYWAEEIGFSPRGMHFTVKSKWGADQPMHTQLLGRHNIYNILAAVAVAVELGMELPTIARAVAAVPPVPHRLVLKHTGKFSIIDDAFNSNPVGSKMALEVLAAMPGGKKIVITPGMVELGAEEYEKNKAFAINCAKTCDYVILVGKKHSQPLQDGLKAADLPVDRYYIADSFQDAYQHMLGMVQQGDYVLIENDLPDTYL